MQESSAVLRRSRIDGQRVNAPRGQGAEGIIHEAMSRRPCQSGEALAHDADVEMGDFAGAGVAGVQVGVVAHLQVLRLQGLAQQGFDGGAVEAFVGHHGLGIVGTWVGRGAGSQVSGVKRMAAELMQ